MARAIGSYPIGRGFKSNFRYQHKADVVNNKICLMIRPVGQAVKTPPFHGGNSSSILLRVTIRNKSELFRQSKLVRFCFLLRVSKLNQKNLESNHFGRSRDSFVISVVCTQRIFRGLGIPQQVEIGSGNGYKKPKPNRLRSVIAQDTACQ